MASSERNKSDLEGSSVEPVSLRNKAASPPQPSPARRSGLNFLLWLVPLAIVILGGGVIAVLQLRQDRDAPPIEPSDNTVLPDNALTPDNPANRADADEAGVRAAREIALQSREAVTDDILSLDAVRREFGRGETRFEAGDIALAESNWNKAFDLYTQAADGFSSAVRLAAEFADVEQARTAWQQHLDGLPHIDLARHAPGPWQEAQAAATAAELAFARDRFAEAAGSWRTAAVALDRATAEFNRLVQEALTAGIEALSAGNRQQALDALHKLRDLQPDHPQLRQLLQRAETIENVRALVISAAEHEDDGDFELARIDYQRALDIDPLALDARAGVARTAAAITNELFDEAIEAGRLQFDQGNFAAAVGFFTTATTLKPGDPIADRLLQQAQAGFETQKLQRLSAAAASAAAANDWQQALGLYNQALAINPGYTAAVDGAKRATTAIAEQQRFKELLTRADALAARNEFDEAIVLLRQASLIRPDETSIPVRIADFQRKLIEQERPVKVTLISDGQSSINIYRVGVIGQIERRTIDLRPGEYTIVASRTGYRSIRKTIVVESGSEPMTLTIQCTERI